MGEGSPLAASVLDGEPLVAALVRMSGDVEKLVGCELAVRLCDRLDCVIEF